MTYPLVAPASLLFVPGNRPERFDKAAESGADLICLDLEDAVAPDERPAARDAVRHALSAHPHRLRFGIRINRLGSSDGLHDLLDLAAYATPPAFVLVPKVEGARDVDLVGHILHGVPLIALVESPRGIEEAAAVAREAAVSLLMFGSFDYVAETGGSQAWDALAPVRSRLVNAASAAGKAVIESPFTDLTDTDAAQEENGRSKMIGMVGRAAIHPRMIQGINAVFRPSQAELNEAIEIVAAFEGAGGAVARIGGKLIELPVVQRMRRTLSRAAGHP